MHAPSVVPNASMKHQTLGKTFHQRTLLISIPFEFSSRFLMILSRLVPFGKLCRYRKESPPLCKACLTSSNPFTHTGEALEPPIRKAPLYPESVSYLIGIQNFSVRTENIPSSASPLSPVLPDSVFAPANVENCPIKIANRPLESSSGVILPSVSTSSGIRSKSVSRHAYVFHRVLTSFNREYRRHR